MYFEWQTAYNSDGRVGFVMHPRQVHKIKIIFAPSDWISEQQQNKNQTQYLDTTQPLLASDVLHWLKLHPKPVSMYRLPFCVWWCFEFIFIHKYIYIHIYLSLMEQLHNAKQNQPNTPNTNGAPQICICDHTKLHPKTDKLALCIYL